MTAFIWLILGLSLLVISGNWLVSGSVQLARHFKISTLVVGLTVVAFGTSAPELFVSVEAAFDGVPDIAIGNVVGSNIANIGLILGLVALVYPIPILNKSIGFDWAVMTLVSILLLILGYNGTIGLSEGVCLLILLAIYIVWSIVKSRKKLNSEDTMKATMKPIFAILLILVSITGLYFGAEWLIKGAREIAFQWGVSDRVIGISVVAFGTSIPELTTSLIAALKKEADISVGNIIGSNLFNILAVLGLTSIIHPLKISDLSMFISDMAWVIGFAVVLLLCMIPLSKGIISRWKGGLLFLLYFVYILVLFK